MTATTRLQVLWYIGLLTWAVQTAVGQPGPPQGLLCELLRYPEKAVITDARPEFGWIVNDPGRGARQTAYQILVASSERKLAQGGDLWDSGKVISDRSTDVEYAGKALSPERVYWWKVRTWDAADRAGPYSTPRRFITGRFQGRSGLFPGESRWVRTPAGEWVLENRQRGGYVDVSPVSVATLGEGHYVADFGKAAFATLRLRAASPGAGDSLVVYLGERKTENGEVHKNPGRSNIGFKRIGVALRKGTRTYQVDLPRHVSHYPNSQVLAAHLPEVMPFRYAEVVAPAGVRVDEWVQAALFHPFEDEASGFSSSDDRLNQVWDLSKYTLKATPFLSLYLDGNRERMPYEADSYIQQLGHYSVDREYAVARYTLNFLLYNASWPTEWQMHTVMMAYMDYLYTGNTEFIRDHYDDLRAKTLLALAREDGLISTRTGLVTPAFLASIHFSGENFRDIVDWPPGSGGAAGASYQGNTTPGERDGYVFTPINTVVNSFHYHALVLMSRMAEAIGKTDDARFLGDRAARVKTRFNELLLDERRGIYVDGDTTDHASLHANMFPLAFGMAPEAVVPSVVAHIRSRGMAASVYGAQYLLEGLYNAGESRYAVDLMTSDAKRSWLNMIRVGSTMTTEAWDEFYKPNLTWNHAWGSAPANIIPRRMMGIEPLEPAFRKIRIRPQPDGVDRIDLKAPTIRGAVTANWNRSGGRYTLDVVVPANTRAEVWLPGSNPDALTEGGRPIAGAEGVEFRRREDGYTVVETGAGSYSYAGPWP